MGKKEDNLRDNGDKIVINNYAFVVLKFVHRVIHRLTQVFIRISTPSTITNNYLFNL